MRLGLWAAALITPMPPPIPIPLRRPATAHHSTGQIPTARRYAPGAGSIAASAAGGGAPHGRAANEGMAMGAGADRFADKADQR